MESINVSANILSKTIPTGAEIISSVTTEKFPIGAVLVRYKSTGIYALVSDGTVSTCDQDEAEECVAEIGPMYIGNSSKVSGELAVRGMSRRAQEGYSQTDIITIYKDGERYAIKFASDPMIFTDRFGAEAFLEEMAIDEDEDGEE